MSPFHRPGTIGADAIKCGHLVRIRVRYVRVRSRYRKLRILVFDSCGHYVMYMHFVTQHEDARNVRA
jgi:hypothetical protein